MKKLFLMALLFSCANLLTAQKDSTRPKNKEKKEWKNDKAKGNYNREDKDDDDKKLDSNWQKGKGDRKQWEKKEWKRDGEKKDKALNGDTKKEDDEAKEKKELDGDKAKENSEVKDKEDDNKDKKEKEKMRGPKKRKGDKGNKPATTPNS
jgi:hypothetical protein